MQSIIVGVDGGDPSKLAAREAVALAESTGAALHFVTAVRHGDVETVESGGDSWIVSDVDIAEQRVRDFAASLGSSVRISVSALSGPPAKAILTEASRIGADLIVVGNRRMQGAGRVLGSVGTDILKQAPCNVLVAKTT